MVTVAQKVPVGPMRTRRRINGIHDNARPTRRWRHLFLLVLLFLLILLFLLLLRAAGRWWRRDVWRAARLMTLRPARQTVSRGLPDGAQSDVKPTAAAVAGWTTEAREKRFPFLHPPSVLFGTFRTSGFSDQHPSSLPLIVYSSFPPLHQTAWGCVGRECDTRSDLTRLWSHHVYARICVVRREGRVIDRPPPSHTNWFFVFTNFNLLNVLH